MSKTGVYVEIGPNLKAALEAAIEMRGAADSASDIINAFDIQGIVEVAVERSEGEDPGKAE